MMERYSRHIALEGFGLEGQKRLSEGKALIIGAGGLGSPCAYYLAAAGVGRIGIADGDVVSISNLQRQILHFTDDIGTRKVDSAAQKLHNLNPEVEVITYPIFLDDNNIDEVMQDYDFIIEASDNALSHYRTNDACCRLCKAFCIGGVSHFSGQMITCLPGTATYRDVFPEPSDDCKTELPVLGPAVGILGSIMAAEAIKFLTGSGKLVTDRLLTFDALTMQFNSFKL